MTKYSQKEAVFNAVTNVCEATDSGYVPSKEERASICQVLFEGFRAGTIDLDANHVGHSDDAKLKNYCSGLLSNWLRKDGRLNGGVKYEAKNPGSRAGSTDPQIKAMRLLLSTKSDPAERAEIQSFIDKRLAEIKPASQAKTLTAEQIAVLEAAGLSHLVS